MCEILRYLNELKLGINTIVGSLKPDYVVICLIFFVRSILPVDLQGTAQCVDKENNKLEYQVKRVGI